MQNIDLHSIDSKEVIPGFHGKFVHAKNITMAYWDVVAGYGLPEHSHEHEQITNIIEGEFELTLNGETLKLYAGAVVVIPANAVHSGKAITHCKIVDVFYPVREDYIL